MVRAERAAAEFQPRVVDVEHDHLRARLDGELRDRQPDRPRADDQHEFVLLHAGAFDGVRADAERLDERELIQRQLRGGMQLARGQHELLAHPAVGVDAEHLDVRAAIRLAPAAGDAFLAVDVRLDRAAVAGFDVVDALADGDDLHAEFVPEDARVGEERLLAVESVDVGAAHADAVHAHQGLARPRARRAGSVSR